MRALLLSIAFLLPLAAHAQSPFAFTNRAGTSWAGSGDQIKLGEAQGNGTKKCNGDVSACMAKAPLGTVPVALGKFTSHTFDIRDYGAIAASNLANGSLNSLALAAAMTACYVVGGGTVTIPATGAAFHLATGLSFTGNGCTITGVGFPNWPGPTGPEAQWTGYGSWLACDDLTKPCLQFLGSGAVDGVNFWRSQPTPSTTASTAWTPSDVVAAGAAESATPWLIQFAQNFSWARNIQIADSSYGIDFEYPANANIAGSYSGLEHIWAGCFVTCVRIKSANDTMDIEDYHGRLLWNIGNSNVIDYKEAHSIGWDLEYVDNLQATDIEFYKDAMAISFADASAVYGSGSLTHAAENLQLAGVAFNQVVQAVNLAAGTTTVSAHFSGVIGQSDTDTNRAAGFFFNFGSDNADVSFNGLTISTVGSSLMAIGGGNSGRVVINGLSLRSPLQASGASNSGYGYLTAASPAFVLAHGSILSIPTGVQNVSAAPSAGSVIACAAPTSVTGSNCGTVVAVVQPTTPTSP